MSDSGAIDPRNPGESWREWVARQASECGLRDECVAAFDKHIAHGDAEPTAAGCALYDWDA